MKVKRNIQIQHLCMHYHYLFTFSATAQGHSKSETSEFAENSAGRQKSEKVSDSQRKHNKQNNDQLIFINTD